MISGPILFQIICVTSPIYHMYHQPNMKSMNNQQDCNLSGPEICRTEYIRWIYIICFSCDMMLDWVFWVINTTSTILKTNSAPNFRFQYSFSIDSECWTKNDPHIVEDDVAHCQTVHEEKCVEVRLMLTSIDRIGKNWCPNQMITFQKHDWDLGDQRIHDRGGLQEMAPRGGFTFKFDEKFLFEWFAVKLTLGVHHKQGKEKKVQPCHQVREGKNFLSWYIENPVHYNQNLWHMLEMNWNS